MIFDTPFRPPRGWQTVRDQFQLTKRVIELSAMSLTSHPQPVASAIDTYRRALDDSPHQFAAANNMRLAGDVFAAVQRYFAIDPALVAFTHSTTVGLSQLHGGIRIGAGGEILTSVNEHFTTLDALRLRARRDGTPFRQVALYRDSRTVSRKEVLRNLAAALRPWTRVVALAWVSSCDGVKLPIPEIARLVAEENLRRSPREDRLLLVVDGVHGFGVENVDFGALGCDLFVAGCHKWLFGPRGTAIMCGNADAWREVVPLLTSFSAPTPAFARIFMPGGNLTFEHFWALSEAFRFAAWVGKSNIQARVRALTLRLKQQLAAIPGVSVVTPESADFSSGLVAFDVPHLDATDVAERLIADPHRISSTVSGPDMTAGRTHVRFSPAIFNTEDEIDRAVEAVAAIAGQ